jgi:7,8-dihydroneopterin aldolase/epimerase/oxygenase
MSNTLRFGVIIVIFAPKKAMGIIEIEGMEFYAYHGCFKEEQVVGNLFMVDLRLETDCGPASVTDQLKDAVNYQKAYQIVKHEMEIKSHLLEHVAGRVLKSLLKKLPQIHKATLKISKMNPPLGGQTNRVSVTMSMQNIDNETLGK